MYSTIRLLAIAFIFFSWCSRLRSDDRTINLADFQKRFFDSQLITHDHLFRNKYVVANLYIFDSTGKKSHSSTITFRSNDSNFVIETMNMITEVKLVTLLNNNNIIHIRIDKTGPAVLTDLKQLPQIPAQDANKIAWHNLDTSFESIGVGYFMYGTPKKSIVESVIDPTTTKDVVSNLKFSVGESIKVEGVFDGKVELYQHYTNNKIVLQGNRI